MKPTDILMQEHRVIELMLDCLDRVADHSEAGHGLDVEAASQAIDFLRVFADKCHHGKEEDLLFPLMESQRLPRHDGPTGVMLHEHELGRRHVGAMAEAVKDLSRGDSEGKIVFAEHARAFSVLLREHIQKEDHCLFQMADLPLTPANQESLSRAFEQVDSESLGPGTHQRFRQIAFALADRLGVSTATLNQNSCSNRGSVSCGAPPHLPVTRGRTRRSASC